MRRATQFNLERNGGGVLSLADVENALDEVLVAGGSLNLKLLGGNRQDDGKHLLHQTGQCETVNPVDE